MFTCSLARSLVCSLIHLLVHSLAAARGLSVDNGVFLGGMIGGGGMTLMLLAESIVLMDYKITQQWGEIIP